MKEDSIPACHYSDQPNDEALWSVERFTEEVEEVRKGLGLNKRGGDQ
jgi:hypothetical protein